MRLASAWKLIEIGARQSPRGLLAYAAGLQALEEGREEDALRILQPLEGFEVAGDVRVRSARQLIAQRRKRTEADREPKATQQSLLDRLSREFSSTLDLNELLGKIATTVRDLINYDAFSIFEFDPASRVLRHLFSVRYDQRVSIDNVPLGKGITGRAAELREVVRVNDTANDPRYIASHPDIRSEIAVSLIIQDRVVGIMDLESERVGYFRDDHLRTLVLLAPQVASSLENARLYGEMAHREKAREVDLREAREVQRLLIPYANPKIEGLDAAVKLRPAREISDDIYDIYEQRDGQTIIALGDVSGKGAAAALYGSLMNGLLRALAPRYPGPGELMKALNDALVERRVEARAGHQSRRQ